MPELTAKSFLSALRGTEILSEQRIAEIEQECAADCTPKNLAIQLVRSGELTSWQAKFLLSGRGNLRIGKYILRERLSQDELGDRILALHQRLDRAVDLQILPADAIESSPAFQSFLRHASEVARLDHPNLIHVYDIDCEGGRYYLVSEHFEGQDVQQLAEGPIYWSSPRIGLIARQLLGGIFYAHSENVLHGDLGPKSLLVSVDGTAKIGNLAIAALKRVIGQHRSSAEPQVVPTPADDYRACANAMIDWLKSQSANNPSVERQQLLTILDSLMRSANEDDAEATIFKLDQWLEQQRGLKPLEKPPSAEPEPTATPTGQQPNLLVPTQPSSPKTSQRLAALPLGRIASLASLSLFVLVLGWMIFRVTRGPDRVSSRAPEFSAPTAAKKDSPKKKASTNPAPARKVTETAGRKTTPQPPESQKTTPPETENAPPPPAAAAKTKPVPAERAHPQPSIFDEPIPPVETSDNVAELPPTEAKPEESAQANANSAGQVQPTAEPGPPSASQTQEPNQAPAVGSGPFSKTPAAVDLPETTKSDESTLAWVDPGPQFLLACNLLTNDAVTRRTKFTLEREPGDQSQAWKIIGDTSAGQPTPIGRLSLAGTDLRFQWLPDATREMNYAFLRNCLLEMQVGEEKFLLRLRKPVEMGAAKVSAAEPQSKLSFAIDAFPLEADLVQCEFLEVGDVTFPAVGEDEDGTFQLLVEPDDQVVPPRSPLFLYLTDKPDRFVFLEIDVKIAKESAITATLRVMQNPKPKPYSEKFAAELATFLKAAALDVSNVYQQAQAYEAPDGKKRDHARRVKELKGSLELAQQRIADLDVQKSRAAALFDKPIRCRVFYRLDDTEIDLATWNGQPHLGK